jgi:multiple RNA-binding domain-containing protein 1
MSRVRILNLPNECTEEQLRRHLLQTTPRDAPLLEITDVQFIRRPANAKDRAHHKQQQHRGKSAAAPKLVLRMAFVGFRTSAAGHFVADYFNNSYFRSARLKVELAKGLNDVGVTVNQLRKQQAEEKKAALRAVQKEAQVQAHDGASRKRSREDGDAKEADEGTADATEEGLARRQREFVDLRSKATEGPTWASEVLLAPETPSGSASQPHNSTDALTGSLSSSLPSPPPTSSSAPFTSATHARTRDAAEEEDPEEAERRALARQQALGEVSDTDFLAGLGGSSGGTGGTVTTAMADEATDTEGEELEREESQHHNIIDDTTATTTTAASPAAAQEDVARLSHRVRLGNIPYTATEEHLKQFAASLVGPVDAVHIPLTKDTRQSKGAAFVRFVSADDAVRALQLCRGAILMGRLLRVSAAEEDPHSKRVMEREAALASTAAAAQAGVGPNGVPGSLAGSSQFKKQREAERRGEGAVVINGGVAGHMTWNTMYMNTHAAVDTVAQRLGVRSEDVVGVGAKGAAVRAAIAEAYLTSEVQQVLSDEGIAFDLLEGAAQNLLKARSNTTILVKNLQLKDGNDAAALTKMFVRFGVLETSAFPSAGTFALFRFTHPQDARIAFTRLSYKLFNNAPLFLEWAPVGSLTEDGEGSRSTAEAAADDLGIAAPSTAHEVGEEATHGEGSAVHMVVYTLFITNVPFQTTEDELHAFLLDACPRLARAPETLIRRLVVQQEQGRAFLTVADESTLTYCIAKINGKTLAGRVLSCVVSKQTAQMQEQRRLARAAVGDDGSGVSSPLPQRTRSGVDGTHGDDEEEDPTKTAVIARRRGRHDEISNGGVSSANPQSKVPPGCDPLKLIVKNLPFEATEKDVRELFAAFSEIRTVRVPRKSHTFSSHRENNHRGFAFVEFLSEAEAARALEALKATHLYGRHLVLQYAKLDG